MHDGYKRHSDNTVLEVCRCNRTYLGLLLAPDRTLCDDQAPKHQRLPTVSAVDYTFAPDEPGSESATSTSFETGQVCVDTLTKTVCPNIAGHRYTFITFSDH